MVPSLFPETFGYVVLESFATGTPVIVHEGGGAIRETGAESGGGLSYRTDAEMLTAMRRMVHDEDLRSELAARGFAQRIGPWSEGAHVHRYMELIADCRESRDTGRTLRVDGAGTARPAKAGHPARRREAV